MVRKNNKTQEEPIEKLRDTLLPKLMIGQVKIEIEGIKYEDL